MKVNPFVNLRKVRIQNVKETIREEQPVLHEKLMGLIMMEGLREEKVSEYLDALVKADLIEYNELNNTWSMRKEEEESKDA